MIHATNDRAWVLTGNNISLGGDLVRRTVMVSIDPGIPNPEKRENFSIPDIAEWVKKHRAELVWALLVLIKSWVSAGMPVRPGAGSDNYAIWVRTVRGILENAGVPGEFDSPASRLQADGVDDETWADFLAAVEEQFPAGTVFSPADIMAKVAPPGSPVSLLPDGIVGMARPIPVYLLPKQVADRVYATRDPGAGAQSLGRYFGNRKSRWCGGLRVVQVGKRRRDGYRWTIEKLPEGAVG